MFWHLRQKVIQEPIFPKIWVERAPCTSCPSRILWTPPPLPGTSKILKRCQKPDVPSCHLRMPVQLLALHAQECEPGNCSDSRYFELVMPTLMLILQFSVQGHHCLFFINVQLFYNPYVSEFGTRCDDRF